jgi:hypothetical protein
MKSDYRVMLGGKSIHAAECFAASFYRYQITFRLVKG